jgi:hypothetical protein
VGLALVWQRHLTSRVTVRANSGAILAGNTQTGALGIRRRGAIITAGGSVTVMTTPRLLFGAEVAGAWSQKESTGGSYAQLQVGGNIVLAPGRTLDWGVIRGQGEVSPAYGVQVGWSLTLGGQ